MIVGFTGTQRGMTFAQKSTVYDLLTQHRPECVVHGDCIGADEEFHDLALTFDSNYMNADGVDPLRFSLRPGCDGRGLSPKQAHCASKYGTFIGVVHDAEPYLERNRKIAMDCDVLIAAPAQVEEQLRGSGTWATIRYATKLGRSVQIVYPDGRIGKYQKPTIVLAKQ